MNLGLGTSQLLQQKLSFGMIQSLKMLQANTLMLEQMIKTELEQNPVLELEADAEIESVADDDYDDDNREKNDDEYLEELNAREEGIDWEEYLEDGFDLGYSRSESEISESYEDRYEMSPVYQETLDEHLTNQLKEKKISERLLLLVQFFISSLDEDGYLRLSDNEITQMTDANICEIEEALNILHHLEPAGVGARDLRECMTLQLRALKMYDTLAMKILTNTNTWEAFQKLKIAEIARLLKVDTADVHKAVAVLKMLSPKPGHQFNIDRSNAIAPDLIVEKVDGELVVIPNDKSIPSLSISKSYAAMLKRGSKARKDVKEYVRERFNSATWFIKSIEQRRSTMIRVMYAIISRQPIFFEKGPPHLLPLNQQEVADMIGMHLSTISRVSSNKYVQTPWGIFELKYFFSETASASKSGAQKSNAQNADDGGDVTAGRIKDRIKQLVEDEDPKQPLADQKIADILAQENMPVARRTVAKYREQMKILPAKMRVKYE